MDAEVPVSRMAAERCGKGTRHRAATVVAVAIYAKASGALVSWGQGHLEAGQPLAKGERRVGLEIGPR